MNKTEFVAWKPFKQAAHVQFARQSFKSWYFKTCFYVDEQILMIMRKNKEKQ